MRFRVVSVDVARSLLETNNFILLEKETIPDSLHNYRKYKPILWSSGVYSVNYRSRSFCFRSRMSPLLYREPQRDKSLPVGGPALIESISLLLFSIPKFTERNFGPYSGTAFLLQGKHQLVLWFASLRE
jgi:hypothetical protein